MRFDAAIRKNVPDTDTQRHQLTRDEDGPMAAKRLPLGAEQRNLLYLRGLQHALQAAAEEWGLRQRSVLHAAVCVATAVFGSCAKFVTQKEVGDLAYQQRALQRLAVVVGITAAVGRRAHIGHEGNAVRSQ